MTSVVMFWCVVAIVEFCWIIGCCMSITWIWFIPEEERGSEHWSMVVVIKGGKVMVCCSVISCSSIESDGTWPKFDEALEVYFVVFVNKKTRLIEYERTYFGWSISRRGIATVDFIPLASRAASSTNRGFYWESAWVYISKILPGCAFFLWLLQLDPLANVLLQNGHEYGRKPVCRIRWFFNAFERLYSLPQ